MSDYKVETLKHGVFNGAEYVGIVIDQGNGSYFASVHEVKPVGQDGFADGTGDVFIDIESARRFVLEEWAKRFGNA